MTARLDRRAARGLAYSGLRFGYERAVTFAVTLVLARLLAPDEFGTVAFALAVMNFLDAATDLGLGAALVYRADSGQARVSSTAFWLGIGGSCLLAAALFAAAPSVASFGPRDDAVAILRVLSLQFPLSALGKVHEYLLRGRLEFKNLVRPFAFGVTTKGAVAVGFAVLGGGVWSLVAGQVAGTAVRSLTLWRAHPWRPRPVFSASTARSLLRFGSGIVAVGVLGQAAKNFDYFVVGAKLGATALGFYFLAFRLPELLVLGMFQLGNEVLFPFYARLKDGSQGSDALRAGYLRTARLAAAIALPVSFTMAALATPLVHVLYGPGWTPAASPLALVAVWASLASLASLPGTVFKATGRSWLLTATGLAQLGVLLPAVWFAGPHGITAVAAVQVAEKTVSLAFLGAVLGRMLRLRWYAAFTAAAPFALCSATAALGVYGIASLLGPLPALGAGIPLGIAGYAVLIRWFVPDVYDALTTPLARLARAVRRSRVTVETGVEMEEVRAWLR